MNCATNRLSGRSYNSRGETDLLDLSGLQHHDLVGERHRLDLVMGHVDHGRSEALVQTRDLEPHLDAECRIKVR